MRNNVETAAGFRGWLLIAAAGAVVAAACGSSSDTKSEAAATTSTSAASTTSTSTSSGAGGAGGAPFESCLPELSALAATPTGTYVVWYANIGELDAGECADPTFEAWRGVGLDLDGEDGVDGKNCEPQPDADPAGVLEDGDNGIDNNFGRLFIPLLNSYVSLSGSANAGFKGGASSILLRAEELLAPPGGVSFSIDLLRTAPLAGAPSWDGTDVFPFDDLPQASSLANAQFDGSTVTFSADLMEIPILALLIDKAIPILLPIRSAKGRMTLDPDGSGAVVTIGGAVVPGEMYKVVQNTAGVYAVDFCMNGDITVMEEEARKAQDVRLDGATSGPCDAISFGARFHLVAANAGDPTPVDAPATPCDP